MIDSKIVKTVIVMNDYAFINGGAAKVAIESAIGISKTSAIKVIFIAEVGPICKELLDSAVEVYCFNRQDINGKDKLDAMIKGLWNRKSYGDIKSIIKKYDPKTTIIHMHGWSKALSASAIASVVNKYKVVITLHDYFSICPNGGIYNYKQQSICKKKPGSISCMLCDCDKRNYVQKIWRDIRFYIQKPWLDKKNVAFIAIAHKNKELVRNMLTDKRFYLVNNPVADILPENGFKNDKQFIFVGRLSEEKGCAYFCDAIAKLQKKYEITGVVLGDGDNATALRNRYADKIDFLGWVDSKEVCKAISKARALVFPSKWYEGAPLTIIEAIALSTPCIVSDCTTTADFIENNNFGYVFKSEDVTSLCQKMEECLKEEEYSKLLKNIKSNFVREDYSQYTHCCNLINAYNDWLNS